MTFQSFSQLPKAQTNTRSKANTPRRSTRLKKEPTPPPAMKKGRVTSPPVTSETTGEGGELHNVPESLEIKEELTKQLGNFMAATKYDITSSIINILENSRRFVTSWDKISCRNFSILSLI